MAKGDKAIIITAGGTLTVEVEVGGRRLTLEEPGAKEAFYVLREHGGSKITRQVLVHKDRLAALDLKVSEDDYTYEEA